MRAFAMGVSLVAGTMIIWFGGASSKPNWPEEQGLLRERLQQVDWSIRLDTCPAPQSRRGALAAAIVNVEAYAVEPFVRSVKRLVFSVFGPRFGWSYGIANMKVGFIAANALHGEDIYNSCDAVSIVDRFLARERVDPDVTFESTSVRNGLAKYNGRTQRPSIGAVYAFWVYEQVVVWRATAIAEGIGE